MDGITAIENDEQFRDYCMSISECCSDIDCGPGEWLRNQTGMPEEDFYLLCEIMDLHGIDHVCDLIDIYMRDYNLFKNNIEEYKLLWITDNKGIKHYIIIDVSDPLFIGHEGIEDGFIHYLDKLVDAENGIMWGMGGAFGGLVAATLAQLIACVPTAGATCISAIATALVGGVGGMFKLAYHTIFEYIPQINNLRDQFDAMDTLRPKADT